MNQAARRRTPQTLPEHIADWMISEISEERLAPGQRVTEQFVAERFQVSHGPVRDAFRMVEKTGLIRLIPRRGAVVAPLDLGELRELFAIRSALTRVLVGQALERASDEQLAELVVLARDLRLKVEDEASFFAASNALGDRFLALSGSARLREILEPLHLQIARYRHHGFVSLAAREASASGYLRIAEAMVSRDVPDALNAVDSSSRELEAEVIKALRD